MSHHVVDLLDSQTKVGSLEACVEVGLQQGLVVHSLVEVITPDLWCILWYRVSASVEILSYWVDMVCHVVRKKNNIRRHKLVLEV